MAVKVAAPKGVDYSARAAALKRAKDIRALRAKPVMTPADRDVLLGLLMDDYLARNPTP